MEETKNVVTNENFDWNAYENDLGVYDHPKEEIAEAYDKTLSNVNVGEVVEGTVTGVNKREVSSMSAIRARVSSPYRSSATTPT